MKQLLKRITAAGLGLAMAVFLLAGCAAAEGENPDASAAPAQNEEASAGAATPSAEGLSANVKDEDLDATWDEATSTMVSLEGESITVSGSGAIVNGSTLTINSTGTYVISGTLEDGQIVVNAPASALVRLVLNGAELNCSTSAPIYCEQADKLLIILAEGTTNTVTDGDSYTFPNNTTDEPSAAIFSAEDLTINGTGALKVTANYNNGIGTKDDLVLVSGTVEVEAANHAIRGRDSITTLDGVYTLTSGNDGLQANNDEDTTKGWINLLGGSFAITSGHDGIQAETSLAISGGEYTITAGGGAGATVTLDASTDSDSYKAVKAGTSLDISGGSFTIDSADDGLHANGSIAVSAGAVTIATGDDGMHADEALVVSGGTIDITQSYEGLEGATITISGGDISVVASDDGINAAGGSDGTEGGGRFGQDMFGGNSDYWVRIEGGTLEIDAGGDGLDSNGDFTITGGEVYVSGPTDNGNGALDYGGSFAMEGGTLVAAGSSGMAQAPGTDSTQPSLMVFYTTTQAAGATIELRDAAGNVLVSYTPTKEYQSAVLSADGLADGETYSMYGGGEKLGEITLSGAVTTVDETGQAASGGMMGGPGGMGGMGGGPGGKGGERPTGEPPTGEPPDGGPPNGEFPEGGGPGQWSDTPPDNNV